MVCSISAILILFSDCLFTLHTKLRAKIQKKSGLCKFFVAFFSSFCKIAGFWMFLHQFCELCSELCSELAGRDPAGKAVYRTRSQTDEQGRTASDLREIWVPEFNSGLIDEEKRGITSQRCIRTSHRIAWNIRWCACGRKYKGTKYNVQRSPAAKRQKESNQRKN